MTILSADSLRRALDVARLAPSAHNTQPWRVVRDGDRLLVRADPERHLSFGDPSRRDLHLSLGAFTEALAIGLAEQGFRSARRTPPSDAFAALEVVAAIDPEREAASLLRQRVTSRLPYSPREPEKEAIAALEESARAHGLRLHLVPRDTPEREKVHRWLFAASRESWLDERATRELSQWVRFDPEGLRKPEDGLSTHCLNLGAVEGAALVALLRPEPWRVLSSVFAAPVLAEQLAKTDVQSAQSAPYVGFLVAQEGDAAASGAGLLRVWMEATRQRLALHPLSVLLDRRGWEVARHLGVPATKVLFTFRLGRSVPAPRSGRLAIERFAQI